MKQQTKPPNQNHLTVVRTGDTHQPSQDKTKPTTPTQDALPGMPEVPLVRRTA